MKTLFIICSFIFAISNSAFAGIGGGGIVGPTLNVAPMQDVFFADQKSQVPNNIIDDVQIIFALKSFLMSNYGNSAEKWRYSIDLDSEKVDIFNANEKTWMSFHFKINNNVVEFFK